jgi:hypothetical protein
VGQAAQNIGNIASGVATGLGSAITSGISYLGWKGAEQSQTGQMGGKMQGFGSDTYSQYMGGGGGSSTNYAPPGGYQQTDSGYYNNSSHG